MSDLDYYAQRAKRYTMDQLTWALGDIQARWRKIYPYAHCEAKIVPW